MKKENKSIKPYYVGLKEQNIMNQVSYNTVQQLGTRDLSDFIIKPAV